MLDEELRTNFSFDILNKEKVDKVCLQLLFWKSGFIEQSRPQAILWQYLLMFQFSSQ